MTGCRLRLLRSAGLVGLLVLALGGAARAASYSSSDAFYWSMPGGHAATAIATSPDGNSVYVADASAKRIDQFDPDGLFVRSWAYGRQRPSSVTTDGFGNVYVLYAQSETIVKFGTAAKKVKILASWNVPFAGSIAASYGGIVYVLTNFLNAVGVYNSAGQSIGGFVANLPGQWFPKVGFDTRYWPQTGYDPPYKTVAREIAVNRSGDPIVVGDSYQAQSNPEPDCSIPDHDLHIDTHPYPDPLDSGEAAEFTPSGSPIAYGWLSESQQNCYNGLYQQSPGLNVASGWQSDGTDPGAVAVDPNGGDVFAVSGIDLGVIHLRPDFRNSDANVSAASSYDPNWGLIAGNPPGPVAVDCRSNLYMIGGGAAGGLITKFINAGPVPPGTCVTLSRFSFAPPPTLALLSLQVGKNGKGTALVGCSGKVCVGTFSLRSSSPCRGCTLSAPRHFLIGPGLQRKLPFQLTALGRHFLHAHPGLAIKVVDRLKGGHTFAEDATLRQPSSLGAVCSFPGISGGAADVSGTLTPAPGRERITIQYLPPASHGLLLPAVQRTVLTNRAGRFEDRYALNSDGKWTIAVSWAGDRTHEPAASHPCAGTVQPIQTTVTLTCPVGSSAGAPAQFSGALVGAPPGAQVGLEYDAPPGADIGHEVGAGATGEFSDSFYPPAPGMWLALAQYKGGAGLAPAVAACEFVVSPAPSTVTVQCSADPNAHFIACTGALTSGGAGIGGAQIKLTYQPPPGAGTATVHTSSTAANGSYTDTLSVPASGPPLPAGGWQVQAQYAGDGTHAPASTSAAVTVP
jgi:hypothetical protein